MVKSQYDFVKNASRNFTIAYDIYRLCGLPEGLFLSPGVDFPLSDCYSGKVGYFMAVTASSFPPSVVEE